MSAVSKALMMTSRGNKGSRFFCGLGNYGASGYGVEEREFAQFLDEFCERNSFYWVRNETSDVKLFRGHYPDFIVFSNDNYVFIEFKGKHLLEMPDSIRKNTIGQMAAGYFMVYIKEDHRGFMQKGWAGERDSDFKEIDLLTAIRTKRKKI